MYLMKTMEDLTFFKIQVHVYHYTPLWIHAEEPTLSLKKKSLHKQGEKRNYLLHHRSFDVPRCHRITSYIVFRPLTGQISCKLVDSP